jgi:hypothetical protein
MTADGETPREVARGKDGEELDGRLFTGTFMVAGDR